MTAAEQLTKRPGRHRPINNHTSEDSMNNDHDHNNSDDGAASTPWPAPDSQAPHGPDDEQLWRCHAKSKQTGQRCGQRAMRGQRVCYAHGGKTKAAMAAAQRRIEAEKVEAQVRAAVAGETGGAVADPFEGLAQLADEALRMKQALADRVNALNDLRYSAPGTGTEQLRAEVLLYERALDRSGKFLDLLARQGFEERRVRVSEVQGLQVAQVLRSILAELGHDTTPGSEAAAVCARHLRALSSTVRGEVVAS